ncbi:hypothetical protein, partial [Klebsiella pneumoniae]|uniref:hypothetical protein n=1 Tax=Klebsiella pneumoniae TaxID=573 RepID=UPI001C6E7C0A
TTASFVSGEYFGLAIKLHLTQLGVQLLGCSPAAPPGKNSRRGAVLCQAAATPCPAYITQALIHWNIKRLQ